MPRDTTPPSLNITNPPNGTTYYYVNTTINVTATANDSGTGVNTINIYVTPPGGTSTLIANQVYTATKNQLRTLSAPYSFNTLGTYTIQAVARDGAGNTSSRSFVVIRTSSTSTTSSTTTLTPPPPPPTLPASKTVATPPAFNQGGEGSCNAQGAALVCSVEQYYFTNSTSYSQSTNILSPEWIYNLFLNSPNSGGACPSPYTCTNISDPSTCTPVFCQTITATACGSGSTVTQNLETARLVGVPTWALCPYSDANGCSSKDFTQAMATDAAAKKIKTFTSVLATDLYSIKRMLCNNHVGSFGMQYDFGDFYYATCSTIWNGYTTTNLASGHQLVVVGYDDAKQAFLCQNSWGPAWGCDGKIWISYNFFTQITNRVFFATRRSDSNFYPIL